MLMKNALILTILIGSHFCAGECLVYVVSAWNIWPTNFQYLHINFYVSVLIAIEIGLFTCQFNGKRYGELDVFDANINGCAKCICIETHVYCNTSRCHGGTTETPTTLTTTSTPIPINQTPGPYSEIEDLNGNSLVQQEIVDSDSEEIIYNPYQQGSGAPYRNRAHVYVHQFRIADRDNEHSSKWKWYCILRIREVEINQKM